MKLRLLFKRVDLITSRLKSYLISERKSDMILQRLHYILFRGLCFFPEQEIPQRLALFVVNLVVLAYLMSCSIYLTSKPRGLWHSCKFSVRLNSNSDSLLKT